MTRHPFDITDKGIIVYPKRTSSLSRRILREGNKISKITVNLNPIGREEIHRLEAAILIGTLSDQRY